MSSQLIFNDGAIKSRLIKKGVTPKGEQWYAGEWKYVADKSSDGKEQFTGRLSCKDEPENIWFPWIGGTAEWLNLTEQEKVWAK